jgi:hypothetical protein
MGRYYVYLSTASAEGKVRLGCCLKYLKLLGFAFGCLLRMGKTNLHSDVGYSL